MARPPDFLLDTDVASLAIRGGSARLDARLRGLPPHRMGISVITRGELLLGVALKPGATRLAAVVDHFLAQVAAQPFTDAAATRFAQVAARLHQAGQPIGTLDAMVAGHALALDAVLVTHNTRHFARVPELKLQDWLA